MSNTEIVKKESGSVKYSVIVPCYNTQDSFDEELRLIQEVFEEKMHTDSYEAVIVNDGSPNPNTLPFLKQMHDKYPFVKLVDLAKNTGQANAQVAAMHFVSGEFIINMDDDLQMDPGYIPELLEKLEEGYDVVFARYYKKKHNAIRKLFTWADEKFEHIFLNKPSDISITSFWVARRYIIDEIKKYQYAYSFMEGLFLRTTRNFTNVYVEHHERAEGESGYNFRSLLKLWSNFTNFTVKPLRIAGVLGIITTIFSIIFMIYTIVRKLMDPAIPQGYSAMMCVMLFGFGLIFIILGVMGEYIGRIFMNINAEPQFIVKQVYEKSSSEPDAVGDDEISGQDNLNGDDLPQK